MELWHDPLPHPQSLLSLKSADGVIFRNVKESERRLPECPLISVLLQSVVTSQAPPPAAGEVSGVRPDLCLLRSDQNSSKICISCWTHPTGMFTVQSLERTQDATPPSPAHSAARVGEGSVCSQFTPQPALRGCGGPPTHSCSGHCPR